MKFWDLIRRCEKPLMQNLNFREVLLVIFWGSVGKSGLKPVLYTGFNPAINGVKA